MTSHGNERALFSLCGIERRCTATEVEKGLDLLVI